MIPKDTLPGQVGPALSNRLADLAERAGEAARAYRRGSVEAIQAYLRAGEALVTAKGECRGKAPGTWGAVLARAGIPGRTAQRMIQAWRVSRDTGADAETIHEAGGVQAFLAASLEAARQAVDAAGEALDAGHVGDPGSVLKSDPPSPAGEPARAPVEAAGRPRPGEAGAVPPAPVSGPPAPSEGLPVAPVSLRQGRRARGLCADCGAVSHEAYRCAPCAARHRAAAGRATDEARIGRKLGTRIREAAARGAGLRLSADDVAGLVAGERAAFGAKLGKIGRGRP